MTAPTRMPWTTRTLTGLLMAGAALTLAPAPAHAAGATSIVLTREAGGEALLTDNPDDGRPVTGQSHHDTIVSTALSAVRSDGTTSRAAFASFATTTYSFDAAGTSRGHRPPVTPTGQPCSSPSTGPCAAPAFARPCPAPAATGASATTSGRSCSPSTGRARG